MPLESLLLLEDDSTPAIKLHLWDERHGVDVKLLSAPVWFVGFLKSIISGILLIPGLIVQSGKKL